MEKNEFHAMIKHLHMKDLTLKEITTELDNVHSTSAPAFATVYNWVNEFKRGCPHVMYFVRDVQLSCLSCYVRNHR